MSSFSGVATGLIDHLGVWGIAIGVFLNGLGVPGISEVLLPIGGVSAQQGRLSLPGLLAAAMLAQLIGSTVAYFIARTGGFALVERYGKYILISHHELTLAQKSFEKYGSGLVFFGAFIPGVQGFVGYIAGVARMNYLRFIISIFFGKLVWIGGLVYLGVVLGDHIDLIDRSVKQIGVVVLAALVAALVWYVYKHRRHSKA